MRSALQQLLASPSALRLPRKCISAKGPLPLEIVCRDGRNFRRSSAVAQAVGEEKYSGLPNPQQFTAGTKSQKAFSPEKVLSFSKGQLKIKQDEQYPHRKSPDQRMEGTKTLQRSHAHAPDHERDTTNWSEVLEIVRERRRHSRVYHAEMIFKKIIHSKLDMPTEGKVATELWDHFIQVLNRDSDSLLTIAEYAVRLRQRTGREPTKLYGHLMGQYIVWRSPSLALSLHQILKADFPPTPADYGDLLRVSLRVGRKCLATFESVYKDLPVPSMYSVVVPKLCMQGLHKEAAEWHYLLLTNDDLPKSFHDCKPLLEYNAHVKNDKAVEDLIRSLAERQKWFEKDMGQFVQNDNFVSREKMNRALGEAHGIAPKTLSDSFCARLFATKFFPVDLVINVLQTIGVQTLGPSSIRELVVRDDHSCKDVVYHMNRLQEAGISPPPSKYNLMIRKAASQGQTKLLKSIVDTDLHPDTFEDINLQERLLATYCEKNDHAQMERTLAIIESTVPERSLKMQRANLLLRCHISLRNRAKVILILESMQRNQYPLTPRSSRHLRRAYLTPRRKGVRPSEHGQENNNLALVINVMKMTLQSGASIPLESWKEILRRLGMMGHLARYQNLALWLVDWYTGLPGSTPPLSFELPEVRPDGLFPSTTRPLPDPTQSQTPFSRISPLASMSNALIQHNNLHVLFGKQAQQGMIAWGFQAEVKRRPNLPQPRNSRLPNPRTHWQWGLRLLKELQGRGVLINRMAVAKACKLRLAQLFNHGIVSNKKANRRAKDLNDVRSNLMAKYRYSAYVRGMEEIWGRNLFQSRNRNLEFGEHNYHGLARGKWRIFQHDKRVVDSPSEEMQ